MERPVMDTTIVPVFGTPGQSVTAADSEMTVVGFGPRRGDVIYNTGTRETFRVTEVKITVVRGVGSDAADMTPQDELVVIGTAK